MKIDYTKLDTDYPQVRQEIINAIKEKYEFTEEVASGIVDYDNDTCEDYEEGEEPETRYNQVKDLMEQDLLVKRPFNILAMAEIIMRNDEGVYQYSEHKSK